MILWSEREKEADAEWLFRESREGVDKRHLGDKDIYPSSPGVRVVETDPRSDNNLKLSSPNWIIRPGPLIAALFLIYIFTAQPGLGWRDNPEFADTAHTLGIAHPAGFPTYSLLAKAAAYIPLAGIPFRVTVFSSFGAAGALYLLYLLICQAAPAKEPKMGDHAARNLAGSGAVLVFGLTGAVWTNATEIEVYTLNLLFLGALLYCAIRWSAAEDDAWLMAGGFIYGLSAGNHATVAFFLPGLLIYVAARRRPGLAKRLFRLALFFLLGLSVYIYLPIRAGAEPAFNFGDPETLSRFMAHITNQKGSSDNFAGLRQGARFFDHLWRFASETVPGIYWVLGFPLTLVGLAVTWKKRSPPGPGPGPDLPGQFDLLHPVDQSHGLSAHSLLRRPAGRTGRGLDSG